MENTAPKISFGFKKTVDKPNLVKKNVENSESTKIELIESIEGSLLKFFGKDPKDEEIKKLVIPITDDQKTRPISKLIESRKRKKEVRTENSPKNDNESLEQKAAREIIEDLKNASIQKESKVLELPPVHPDELPLNGAVESSIDDYERIPISDFGKAMLRGMGWKEQENKEDLNKFDAPVVRPKGLGLGADKVIKKQKLLVQPAANETLEIKKNACVKVLAGKHKNLYGTIEGFDDGGGRLIVKLAIGALKVLMNEFMVQPVPKQEYAKYSKILNSEKYEEFKNDENKTAGVPEKGDRERRKSRSLSPSTSRGRDDNRSSYKSRDENSTSRNRDDNISSRSRDDRRASREVRDDNKRNKSYERDRSRERRRSRERTSNHHKKETRHYSSDSEDDKTSNRKYNERRRSRSHERHRKRHSSSDSGNERYRSKKKSSKKSSKSKSKKYDSPDRYRSSDDERKHKRKYKRSKHHRDRS